MINKNKIVNDLILKSDLPITVVLVVFVVYFIAIAGFFEGATLIYLIIGSTIATIITGTFQIIYRRSYLTDLENMFKNPNPDYKKIYNQILVIPTYESVSTSFRWIVGGTLLLVFLSFQVSLNRWNIIPLVIIILSVIPITYFLIYHNLEFYFKDLLMEKNLRKISIENKDFNPFKIMNRIILLLVSILLIPITILGYFLFLSNIEMLKLNYISVHIFFVMLYSLFIVGYATNFLTKSLNLTINVISESLEKLKKGDLTFEDVPIISNDEISFLSQPVNSLMNQLRSVLKDINNTSGYLANISSEVSSTSSSFTDNTNEQSILSDKIVVSIEAISSGFENSTKSTKIQYEKIQELLNIKNKLSNKIYDVKNSIVSTTTLSQNISIKATEGGKTLELINTSMQQIRSSSKEVTSIINIINEISEQINLLSLNASIEAARAGIYGRGFAVVASEISKLADRTASSIKNIEKLIKLNDIEIGKGMVTVSQNVNSIGEIIEGISTISQKMNVIKDLIIEQETINEQSNIEIQVVKDQSSEIQAQTQEQIKSIREIVKTINSINQLTHSTANGSKEIAIAAGEVANYSETLKTKVEYFKI
jgi:methyl-accepting chemotaxis protein